MTARPFGFRVVGHRAGRRRLVDWRAALTAYADCDPKAQPEREAYLSHFVFGPDFAEHWLCRNQVGEVTYTFSPRHGLVGGQIVPYLARLLGGRIDPQRKDEVATYLTSFGLTPYEAADVIQAVGTGPVKKPRRTKAGTA